MMRASLRRFVFVPTALVVLTSARSADACATCFGDPNSPMAKGAVMGVVVLVGVVGFVLLSMVGTGLFWFQRSRRIARLGGAQHDRAD